MSEGVNGPLRVAGVPAYVPLGGRVGEEWAYLLYCGLSCDGLGLDWLSQGDFARSALVPDALGLDAFDTLGPDVGVALAASYRSLGVSRPFAAAAS
jgi:hypothetical protein